jgi:Acetyl-CoA dehydrogenase C-terminal like
VALRAQQRLADDAAYADLLRGLLAAETYFFHYELPRIGAWLAVVETRDATCRSMNEAWF